MQGVHIFAIILVSLMLISHPSYFRLQISQVTLIAMLFSSPVKVSNL